MRAELRPVITARPRLPSEPLRQSSVSIEVGKLPLTHRQDRIRIKGVVRGRDGVMDVRVFANERKVLCRRASPSSAALPLDADAPLAPGVNVLRVIARDRNGVTSSRMFIVRRDGTQGEPLPARLLATTHQSHGVAFERGGCGSGYSAPMADTTVIGNVLLGIGGIQLAAGALYFASNAFRRRGRVRIEGAIVDHETSSTEEGTYYEPVIEYVTPAGERRRVKYGIAFPTPRAADGSEQRGVWYDPSHPEKSYVDVKLRPALPIPMTVILMLPFVVLALGIALRFAR